MENSISAAIFTRRKWNAMVLAGIGALLIDPLFSSGKTTGVAFSANLNESTAERQAGLGVVLGIQTYSFRDLSLDETIIAMQKLEIKSCELWDGHLQPRELKSQASGNPKSKAELRSKWLETLEMSTINAVKEQFATAGISITAYTSTIKDNTSDQEIDQMFRIAQTLGVNTINSSSTVRVMRRIDPFAGKYKMKVAMHNHSHVENPNEISSPATFARATEGLSEYININLDIGHFTAANFDPVEFMKQNYTKILSIHVKDRKKNQGANVPLGEGDTPVAEVLKLIRNNKWPIPANIEYEYKGGNTLTEVKKCLDYCKQVLQT